jgi:non-reducing end alpha-L-arabinofuranosidase
MGYRRENTTGIATGDAPESMYMVVDGRHYNNRCCFDFGNAETDAHDDGKGTMEAIYWGNYGNSSTKRGPWVMADLENGLWAGKDGDGWHGPGTPQPIDAVSGALARTS